MGEVLLGMTVATVFLGGFFLCVASQRDIPCMVFLSFIIIPTVSVGGFHISLTYIWMIVFAVTILLTKQETKVPRMAVLYCIITVLLIVVYVISYGMKNPNANLKQLVQIVLIYSKYIVLMLEACIIIGNVKNISDGLQKALEIGVLINSISVAFQMLIPIKSAEIIDAIFYRENSINQSEAIVNGEYGRLSGVFQFPALSGIFSLLSIAYFITQSKAYRKKKMYVCLAVICGVASMSKTFYIGIFIVIVIWIVQSVKNRNKRAIQICVALILLIVIFLICYDEIIAWLMTVNVNMAYYVSTILDPLKAMEARYDLQSGFLIDTIAVVKENLLIGVGPYSVQGEFVGDNGYLTILHNGGLIAFALVAVFYFVVLLKTMRTRNRTNMMELIVIAASGMAYNSIWFNMITCPLIVYMVIGIENDKKVSEEI